MGARLVVVDGWDERAAFEAESRGYASASVELVDGRRVAVTFWDVVRLGQDLADEARAGRPFLAEPGMIVVTAVTRANMEAAVARLERDGFFERVSDPEQGTR